MVGPNKDGVESPEVSAEAIWRCLSDLTEAIPCQYAQWLIEDSLSHDYRVVASLVPEGQPGYEVAHRTGIIGQVFRTKNPIIAPNVKDHPLYDPFDDSIGWELCFPLFGETGLIAVVNLEGAGLLENGPEEWGRVREVVGISTPLRPPSTQPQSGDSCLLTTVPVAVPLSAVVPVARILAGSGNSTLVVGHHPELLRGRGPTMIEANRQAQGIGGCFFGVEGQLDLLATGLRNEPDLLSCKDWWSLCLGRYSFVVEPGRSEGESVQARSKHATSLSRPQGHE